MSAIAQAIKQAAQRGEQIYLKLCEVDSVNESERTIECTPADGSAQLIGVCLQSVTDESEGLFIAPKVGSFVTVGFLDKNNAVVLMFSEIEKITLDVSDKIEINGGTFGGLVKIEELNNRLKSLEQKFNNHTHSGVIIAVSGGSGAPAVGTPGNSGAPTSTSNEFQSGYSGYENDKITH